MSILFAVDKPPLDGQHPWPGLDSFSERDSDYFRGRDEEADALFRFVQRGVLTVLYGVSGLGKTSLLEAGLFPRLREARCLPVSLRLDFSETAGSLLEQVRYALVRTIEQQEVDAKAPEAGENLWSYFHRTPFWSSRSQLLMPVLVFDQFEEIFTLGRNHPGRRQLRQLLADLVENNIPDALAGDAVVLDFDYSHVRLKVVLALREDFLAQLEEWRPDLPSLMRNRFRLRPMHGEAAQRAVIESGAQVVDSPLTAGQIVRFVAGAESIGGERPVEDLVVEPALLSLFCRELNTRRIDAGIQHITRDLLKDARGGILVDFYERSLEDLGQPVRRFVEDQLLTVSGYRDSVALDNALGVPGVTREAIDQLVSQRLIRLVPGEHIRIELIHDVLCGAIDASRAKRHEREALAEAEKQRLEQAEIHARQLEKERAKVAEARVIRFRRLAIASILMVLSFAVVSYYAWLEKTAAETASRDAQARLELVENESEARKKDQRALEMARYGEVAVQEALWRMLRSGARDAAGALRLGLKPPVLETGVAHFWHEMNPEADVPELAVALSPQGKLLVSGAADGDISRWEESEFAHRWVYGEIPRAQGAVVQIRFSVDGSRWMTVLDDGAVRIYDGDTGHEPVVLKSYDGPVLAVFGADTGWPVRTLSLRGTLLEWGGVESREEVRADMGPALAAAFDSLGEQVVTGTFDGRVQVWKPGTDAPLVLGRQAGPVLDVAFSPDAARVASAGAGGTVHVWFLSQEGKTREFKSPYAGLVSRVTFSPDGKLVGSVHGDGQGRFWEVSSTSAEPWKAIGDDVPILDLAFSPDSQQVATAMLDGTIRLWTLERPPRQLVSLDPRATGPTTTPPPAIDQPDRIPLNWFVSPPQQAFCYQEDSCHAGQDGGRRYSVHCHWSLSHCKVARGENADTSQSSCTKVNGLDETGWHPLPRGYMDSWYQFSAVPFPAPFPSVGTGGQVFLHVAREDQRSKALELGRELCLYGFSVPGVEKVKSSPAQSQLRYFDAKEEDLEKIRRVLKKEGLQSIGLERTYNLSQLYPGMPADRYELWLGRNEQSR